MKVLYIESIDENVVPDTEFPYEKIVIRKPKPPRVAKVKRFKQVGAREWSTIYRVKDDLSNILYSHEVMGVAINWAKARAIKDLKEYSIYADKALTNADPRVAIVGPGKYRLGKVKFTIIDKNPK